MQLAPHGRDVAQPGAETPAGTLEVGRDVGSDHRRLHQKGAYTTHRVGQGAACGSDAWPASANQNGSGKVFLEWRGALLQAIATLVQAVPGQVERENGFTAIQAQVHAQVRIELVDAGTLATGRAQLVDDGILDLQRTEVSIVDARAMPTEFHGQGAIGQQVVLPLDIESSSASFMAKRLSTSNTRLPRRDHRHSR